MSALDSIRLYVVSVAVPVLPMVAALMMSSVSSAKLTSIVAVSPVFTFRPFTATLAPSSGTSYSSGTMDSLLPPFVAPTSDSSKFQVLEYFSPLWMVPAPNKILFGVSAVIPFLPSTIYVTFHSFTFK